MAKKKIKPVVKPYLRGSWHGKQTTAKGLKSILSILFISFIYLLLGILLSFNAMILRVMMSVIIVSFAALYMFNQGTVKGEADTAYGEIMYQHQQEGKTVVEQDSERCYHPAKGFTIILIALLPYLLITLVFALMAQPIVYNLGVLPSWLDASAQQSHVGEALSYYSTQGSLQLIDILRIAVRAMTMPFINIAIPLGKTAVLWAERLSPLWITIAPIAYAFGYMQGPKLRIKINTGIAIGMRNKRRKERKARKARVQSKKPEQLI